MVFTGLLLHRALSNIRGYLLSKSKDKLKEKFTGLIPSYKFRGGNSIFDQALDTLGNKMAKTGAEKIFDEGIKLPQNALYEGADLTPQQILTIQQFLLGGK